MDVLIDAETLAARLGAPDLVLLDVRYRLGRTDGHEEYLAGHLRGAVFADLDADLAAPPSPEQGRHPLPDLADLQAAARRWGIGTDSDVVVYDDWNGLAAARAWWLLRWGGVRHVRILDGALAGWRAGDRPLETGEVTAEPGDVVLAAGGMPTVDADAVAALAEATSGLVLDARAGERYRGESEPLDPQAGHIPGAVSAPTTENLGADGAFLPGPVLAQRFSALGADSGMTVATYCGSGVTAAHQVAALALADIDAALYPGSWSQWSNDPDRPVATGPNP